MNEFFNIKQEKVETKWKMSYILHTDTLQSQLLVDYTMLYRALLIEKY